MKVKLKDPDLAMLFTNTFSSTLDTTVRYFDNEKNLAFIITGVRTIVFDNRHFRKDANIDAPGRISGSWPNLIPSQFSGYHPNGRHPPMTVPSGCETPETSSPISTRCFLTIPNFKRLS